LKLLKLRLAKLQASRNRWREKARQLQAELKQKDCDEPPTPQKRPPRGRRTVAA
jgi:hypothetical protein